MGKQYLEKALDAKLSLNEKIFVPYIMAGDGGLDNLEERLRFLQACGATAVELGIPFSDPVADGPTIQDAGVRALANGTTLFSVIEKLKQFKEERTIPVILMTYINPILIYGIEKFASDCVQAGVDGVIIPDLPLEEEGILADYLRDHEIALIRLAALTSPEERIVEIAKRTEGFLYAVSVTGTTGVRTSYQAEVNSYLQKLKQHAHVPVLAGFGVSNPKQAQELSASCDGVVVGSKIVDLFHQGKTDEIKTLIRES